MSEGGKDSPATKKKDLLSQETILAQAPGILTIARNNILGLGIRTRAVNQVGSSDIALLLGSSFLDDTSNLVNGSKHIILDDETDYTVEKRGYQDFVEIVLTRSPFKPTTGAGVVSEGIRIRIDRFGKGGNVIEYHLKEKDENGKPIVSTPLKNTTKALASVLAFVQSIM
jgi:hypothetical protein